MLAQYLETRELPSGKTYKALKSEHRGWLDDQLAKLIAADLSGLAAGILPEGVKVFAAVPEADWKPTPLFQPVGSGLEVVDQLELPVVAIVGDPSQGQSVALFAGQTVPQVQGAVSTAANEGMDEAAIAAPVFIEDGRASAASTALMAGAGVALVGGALYWLNRRR